MGSQLRITNLSIWFLLVGFACVGLSTERAAASTDNEQLLIMIRALEARIRALETKNKEYRQEAGEARLQARAANEKLKLVSASTSQPRNSFALASSEPNDTSAIWSGAYWGAAAGGGITRSRVTANEQYISNFPTNGYPYNINGSNMADSSGPGHRGGALIDVFAGWNFQPSRSFVVGGQLEATVSDLNFNSAGTRMYNYFTAAGPTGETAVENFRPQVSTNWMASALLRAGFLVDDKTLIYGIGGLTLAQFQTRNLADNSFFQTEESFVATGWTAGAGIERKLDANWSVRGEYRYTRFGSHGSNDQFNFVGSFPSSQTYQRNAQFDQSMQVGRIGIAYAIGVPPR
jgi:outer membrane immunogenic protein